MVCGGGVVKHPERDDTAVLITEAEPSYEDQFAARKRKYMIMMSLRLPCLLLAGIFHETWWLALGFVALSIPLPWVAVLIANDRPPRRAETVNRYQRDVGQIEAGPRQVIEG
ncbi:DUF3099 domain-containing protein [Actinokineospora guangxiensis]|uniref:DUF3099 domain-containing protein n=1 Tax=Actinokineospora guangxiensis TaxID=1490288 RepID=A0ABW0EK01_9PSEU